MQLSEKESRNVNELEVIEGKILLIKKQIFKVQMQVSVGSKTKSYQIQRGLSLLFIFSRQLSFSQSQDVVFSKSFIIFLFVLKVLICNMQFISRLLPLGFTKTPSGKALGGSFIRIRPANFLLDYLVVTHQTFFHQALLPRYHLVTTSTITFTH